MKTWTRVIIVQRGDTAMFESLCRRFMEDPTTVVIYDRRGWPREEGSGGHENRRWPQDARVLLERGYFVVSRVRPVPEELPHR
jgi:hypothetical protein